VPGEKIEGKKAAAGCPDPTGGTQFLGFFTCADGRLLFSVDAHTGAPAGWGCGGSRFHPSDEPAADPAYGKAYGSCNG
jgi:hypothetical protein